MVGQFDELFPRDVALTGVGAKIVVIGDAVAWVEIGDARPDRDDFAGRFIAGDERQPRRLVQTGAVIDVDEIQADSVLADTDFARSRRRQIDSFVDQGFRTSHLVHAHSLDHLPSPLAFALR